MSMALLYLLFATYYLARGPDGKLTGTALQLTRENVWAAALVGSMYTVSLNFFPLCLRNVGIACPPDGWSVWQSG